VLKEFRHEVWVLSGLSHPNIIKFYGFTVSPTCCMVTEFLDGGDLFSFIGNEKNDITWELSNRHCQSCFFLAFYEYYPQRSQKPQHSAC